MQLATTIAAGISSTAFVWHGASCFVSRAATAEFERYRLARFRLLTGALQLAGGIGLLVGLRHRPVLLPSAAGLAVMMFLGVIVHLRIRDPGQAAIPALMLLGLNLFIAVAAA